MTSQTPSSTLHFDKWTRYFRHRDKIKSLKIRWIQRVLNPNNALWKYLMLYQFNLILNYNQGLALFRRKQILRSNSHKHLQKQNNENFFIQLLNAWQITTSLPSRL